MALSIRCVAAWRDLPCGVSLSGSRNDANRFTATLGPCPDHPICGGDVCITFLVSVRAMGGKNAPHGDHLCTWLKCQQRKRKADLMTAVILWKNTQNDRVGFISDGDDEIAAFANGKQAEVLAGEHPLLQSFPYQIVEVEI